MSKFWFSWCLSTAFVLAAFATPASGQVVLQGADLLGEIERELSSLDGSMQASRKIRLEVAAKTSRSAAMESKLSASERRRLWSVINRLTRAKAKRAQPEEPTEVAPVVPTKPEKKDEPLTTIKMVDPWKVGWKKYQDRQYDESVTALRQIEFEGITPTRRIEVTFLIATALRRDGKTAEAVKEYEKVIEMVGVDPKHQNWGTLATWHIETIGWLKKTREAIDKRNAELKKMRGDLEAERAAVDAM